ncbi:MAG: sulfatase [Opitutales bacterium]|nr:sulfatase [Opitutales bacterium]
MKKLLSTLALMGLGLGSLAVAEKSEEKKPFNVIMIAVDDLNNWVGELGGHPNAITPNMDKLAKKSTVFEHAYPAAPLCNPSRTAVLTGLHPANSGIYCNKGWFREKPGLEDWVTLPQYFQKHGYSTFGGGKLYHHPKGKMSDEVSWEVNYHRGVGTQNPPEERRYQHGLKGAFNDTSWYFNKALDWGHIDESKEETADWKTADGAVKILQQDHDKPFFIGVGIFRPHLTWYAPKEFFDMHPLEGVELPPYMENDLTDVPPIGRRLARKDFPVIKASGKWKEAVRAYLACTSFADACIGHLLDGLENSKYKDNTIVVLWGDHGWNLGEKDHWAKYALWEDTNQTPFFFYVPGEKSSRVKHAVNLLDLYPTLVDLCGLPKNEEIDGRSLVQLIEKPKTKKWAPSVTTHWKDNHAIVDQRYRYIRYRDGGEELYDHEIDPYEWVNRANDPEYKDVIERLAKWIPEHNEEHWDPEAPENM